MTFYMTRIFLNEHGNKGEATLFPVVWEGCPISFFSFLFFFFLFFFFISAIVKPEYFFRRMDRQIWSNFTLSLLLAFYRIMSERQRSDIGLSNASWVIDAHFWYFPNFIRVFSGYFVTVRLPSALRESFLLLLFIYRWPRVTKCIRKTPLLRRVFRIWPQCFFGKFSVDCNGPRHAKTFLRAYAGSEGPDQPGHSRSLIRAFPIRAIWSGHSMWKRFFGHIRTAKVKISLRIRTVWSGHSLSAQFDQASMRRF